jgi:hypothetical protein
MDNLTLKRHHERSNHSTSTSRFAEEDYVDDSQHCVFETFPDEASIEESQTDFQWLFCSDPYSTITAVSTQPKQQSSLSYPTKEYLNDHFHSSSSGSDDKLISKKSIQFL